MVNFGYLLKYFKFGYITVAGNHPKLFPITVCPAGGKETKNRANAAAAEARDADEGNVGSV